MTEKINDMDSKSDSISDTVIPAVEYGTLKETSPTLTEIFCMDLVTTGIEVIFGSSIIGSFSDFGKL